MLKKIFFGVIIGGMAFGAQAQSETAFTPLANGFDFPVGKPEGVGYYKARGFRPNGHLGEDWDGIGGGNTDLRAPVFSIGDGVVVFARDVHRGWGNVVIVRSAFRESGMVKNIDALYGHLDSILVHRGQSVLRGHQIATMGTHRIYDAHLHFEIRKNIEIGMSRAAFRRDFSNYYIPTNFILSHRHLQTMGSTYRVAMNSYAHDAAYNIDGARNFSRRSPKHHSISHRAEARNRQSKTLTHVVAAPCRAGACAHSAPFRTAKRLVQCNI